VATTNQNPRKSQAKTQSQFGQSQMQSPDDGDGDGGVYTDGKDGTGPGNDCKKSDVGRMIGIDLA